MTDASTTQREEMSWREEADRRHRARLAEMTRGLEPSNFANALMDWTIHLAASPGKQVELMQKALMNSWRLGGGGGALTAPEHDHRFQSSAWSEQPFSLLRDAFLMTEDWWMSATTDIRGLSKAHEATLSFTIRQALDAFSPSNFPASNPDILSKSIQTRGANFLKGAENLARHVSNRTHDLPVDDLRFTIGEGLAATKGKVVARTHLMELIQYAPTTAKVRPEPVLITPAWIMKYYILDLSAHNSFVAFLLSQGFTVFMISWRNPDSGDRDLGMEDYLEQGPMAALDAVCAITGATRVHTAGYCLGGTLLSIAAAAMARKGDGRIASLTLIAAQTDFSEPGELRLFISEAQVALLEDMMWERGYLDGEQMAGAFTMLRSNDLLWSRLVHDFFMGEETELNDLMVWNADTTRMPARMHSEYLRRLFLENRLSQGKYRIHGHKISLMDLRQPVLTVGTETDHVAPWKSVYKAHHLTEAETTFILTNGGHNAGILSEPGHRNRRYRIATTPHDAPFRDADAWFQSVPAVSGSWWPAMADWLARHSSAAGKPPPLGKAEAGFPPLADAPGTYVLQK